MMNCTTIFYMVPEGAQKLADSFFMNNQSIYWVLAPAALQYIHTSTLTVNQARTELNWAYINEVASAGNLKTL